MAVVEVVLLVRMQVLIHRYVMAVPVVLAAAVAAGVVEITPAVQELRGKVLLVVMQLQALPTMVLVAVAVQQEQVALVLIQTEEMAEPQLHLILRGQVRLQQE